jgi:hypothetical protein
VAEYVCAQNHALTGLVCRTVPIGNVWVSGSQTRLKEIQEKIESEMKKQDVPADISVAEFVRRPDAQFEQQRQEVAKALGWQP